LARGAQLDWWIEKISLHPRIERITFWFRFSLGIFAISASLIKVQGLGVEGLVDFVIDFSRGFRH
jgi:hypothetical protein